MFSAVIVKCSFEFNHFYVFLMDGLHGLLFSEPTKLEVLTASVLMHLVVVVFWKVNLH